MRYLLIVIMLMGCAQEKSIDNSTSSTESTLPIISNITISTKNIKKLAILAKSSNISKSLSFAPSADTTGDVLIALDSSGDIINPISKSVPVYGYNFSDMTADNILINGNFVGVSNGSRIFDCWLIATNLKKDGAHPTCLQESDSNYKKVIHSTTAKELGNGSLSSTPGDQEKGMFALNKIGGGFTIKRWDGIDNVEIVKDSSSGTIDNFYSGNVLEAAVGKDSSGDGVVFFGNPTYGWHYNDTQFPIYNPVYFDNSLFYTKRYTENNGEYGNFTISMTKGSSTAYGENSSIDCNLPDGNQFKGDDRVFWISAVNNKLCSIKKYPEATEGYQHTIDNISIAWEFGVNDGNKLFIYGLDVGVPHLQVIDIERLTVFSPVNTISSYGLDSVTSLERYINGIKITGLESGSTKIIYFDTSSDSIDASPSNTETVTMVEDLK